MEDLPCISIVTPVLNQRELLDATLRSVLDQDYPHLQVVVVDGGSTDGSVDVIRRHAARLTAWSSEADAGPYDAINKGFARTSGEVMAWLNAGDLLHPWALRAVGSLLASHPQVQWVSSLAQTMLDTSGLCSQVVTVPGFARQAFFDGLYAPGGHRPTWWIQQESTFWRRSLWHRAGAQLQTRWALAADFALWARFYAYAELVGTPTPLGMFRTHPGQRSGDLERYTSEATAILHTERSTLRIPRGRARRAALMLGQAGLPRASLGLLRRLGYPATRAVRQETGAEGARWVLQPYRFMP